MKLENSNPSLILLKLKSCNNTKHPLKIECIMLKISQCAEECSTTIEELSRSKSMGRTLRDKHLVDEELS